MLYCHPESPERFSAFSHTAVRAHPAERLKRSGVDCEQGEPAVMLACFQHRRADHLDYRRQVRAANRAPTARALGAGRSVMPDF